MPCGSPLMQMSIAGQTHLTTKGHGDANNGGAPERTLLQRDNAAASRPHQAPARVKLKRGHAYAFEHPQQTANDHGSTPPVDVKPDFTEMKQIIDLDDYTPGRYSGAARMDGAGHFHGREQVNEDEEELSLELQRTAVEKREIELRLRLHRMKRQRA
ncbi:hypothetical protein LTR08_007923 [Meristemomyces frigidus]|nr:hypothetical protein LTR08_007923 [Meristemomyces frigidus]